MLVKDELETIVCRPALRKDTDQVMELSSHIWEGHDYIPLVWNEWLADPNGLLGVAEFGGRVAGVFKLTRFGDEEWWMEGLRVHPDFQGKGIAAHIHNYVVDTWRKIGGGKVRLVTHSENLKVHHVCEQNGFSRLMEVVIFTSPVLKAETGSFRLLNEEEVPKALDLLLASETLGLAQGLVDLGWVWVEPKLKHIQSAVQAKHAWWWRDGLGFLAIYEDVDDDEREPGIQLLACPVSHLPELLTDYRTLMGMMGYDHQIWVAPNRPAVLSALEQAGFERGWDKSLYIYELKA